MERSKLRNSNLEIIRIISMVLIVAHHYACHGFIQSELPYSFNRYVVGFLTLGGNFGVVCFVIISGYFMCRATFRLTKLIKLVAEVWFYSVSIGLLFLFALPSENPMGIKDIIKMCAPIGFNGYWFMTYYVILLVLSPMLNIIVNKADKSAMLKLILVFTTIWSIIPSFAVASYGFSKLGWFVLLFFIGAYIRNYSKCDAKDSKKHFVIAFCAYGVIVISNFMMIFLGHALNKPGLSQNSLHFAAIQSPFVLLSAVSLLKGFAGLKPHYSKPVNLLASATLGVYLIHDNSLMRPYLWQSVFKNSDAYQSGIFIIHAMLTILIVYLGCTIIDLIRIHTVEKGFIRFLNNHIVGIKNKTKSICCSLWNHVSI